MPHMTQAEALSRAMDVIDGTRATLTDEPTADIRSIASAPSARRVEATPTTGKPPLSVVMLAISWPIDELADALEAGSVSRRLVQSAASAIRLAADYERLKEQAK